MNKIALGVVLALQVFQVAFLWLHDWVSLGPLNDVNAVTRIDSRKRLVWVTIVQSLPFTLGLVFTLLHLDSHWPRWLWLWLLVSYGILFIGQLRAWWVPYVLRADAQRAERYSIMFGNTHSFLPMRNGLVPNTLHILLHIATLAMLLVTLFEYRLL